MAGRMGQRDRIRGKVPIKRKSNQNGKSQGKKGEVQLLGGGGRAWFHCSLEHTSCVPTADAWCGGGR